jgi:ribosomal-protein-alanine acetyltransferase
VSPDAPPSGPGASAASLRIVWNARPTPKALALLDTQCFNPAWDASTYVRLLQEPTSCAWLVRFEDPRASIGWIACHRVADEAEILRLGVLPPLRYQGWGQRLLDHALSQLAAAEVRTVFLEVRAGNSDALALYRKLGFRETGRRRGYYRDPPEDALLMGREI